MPKPRSYFILARCPSCGNEQILFSHATFPARCIVCGHQLVEPRGGRCKINAQIMRYLG
ncbi:MAG: 30S ribosomal protein S27e [Fervidicoccaceae archaeon]